MVKYIFCNTIKKNHYVDNLIYKKYDIKYLHNNMYQKKTCFIVDHKTNVSC